MRPRKLLRIARWEVTKNAGGIDRRTLAIAAVAIAFIAVVAPLVAGQGAVLDDGLYRVGVSEDSPYYEVVQQDATFAVRPADSEAFRDGNLDLLVDGRDVVVSGTPKSRAAAEELRSSVERYNDDQLRDPGENQSAAFPVTVTLRYAEQANTGNRVTVGSGSSASGSGGADGGTGDGSDGDSGDATGGTTDGPSGSGSGGSGGATGGSGGSGGGFGGFGSQLTGSDTTVDSPSNISPPFPFQSLVLAFVFIVPLNFLIQAYGSTILSERLNRRGELMLVSPVSRVDIVGGKTLPYFAGAMVVEGAIALGLTYLSQGTIGGLVSVAAIVPLVLLFLSSTFLGAMFARSFKELTFVTVTITVSLTSYAFVPAIFTDVNPIALISPLTIVVRDLQGQSIAAQEFLFSTVPPLLSAFVLFGLGAGLYREEDMFAQRSIPLKVLDALAGRVYERWHVLALTALLLPFVFVLELLSIATLFALQGLSIPLVLVAVAVIEEIAKSLHVYAAFTHSRFARTTKAAAVLGLLSGVGFFLGEKITLLAQLVGLPQLEIGNAALGPVSGPLVVAFLLAPLLLHVVTATISSLGASRGRRPYVAALGLAILVHLAYNYSVVVLLG